MELNGIGHSGFRAVIAVVWRTLARMPGSVWLARCGLTHWVRTRLHRETLKQGRMCAMILGRLISIEVKTVKEIERLEAAWRETWLLKRLDQSVKDGSLVWDVGANIGIVSLWLATAKDRRVEVVAFEPMPDNAEALRANIELNARTNIHVCEAALSDKEGHAQLAVTGPRGDGRHTLVVDASRGAALIDVTLRTGDEVAAQRGREPDVVKIDVEGAEVAVLAGMNRMLSRGVPPDLFLELHPKLLQATGNSETSLRNHLERLGYTVVASKARGDEVQLHAKYLRRES